MSIKGIFTALSGAMAQSERLDTIANNIANSNTQSFKKDKQIFQEYLTAHEKPPKAVQVPKTPASLESFYDMQGGSRSYVDSAGTFTDFTQGVLKPTGNPLDIALEGEGFFELLTPQGVRYTRDGSLKVDGQGRLVNKDGQMVLSAGTGDPTERIIQVHGRNITVSYNGDVYQGGQQVAKLSIQQVDQSEALRKVGHSQYVLKPDIPAQLAQAQGVRVHQGFLEGSNVNIVSEMTDMISASRAFEGTQKAIKAFDEMNEKLVNVVPKTT